MDQQRIECAAGNPSPFFARRVVVPRGVSSLRPGVFFFNV